MKSWESHNLDCSSIYCVLVAVSLLVCSGCWKEVHYDPEKPAKATLTDTTTSIEEVTATELFENAEPVDATVGESPDLTPIPAATPSQFVEQELHESVAAIPVSIAPEIAKEPIPSESETVAPSTTPESEQLETPSEPPPTMRPSKTALAVWRSSSRWSLAAAIYAKSQPEDRYREALAQAAYAADLIGVNLPSFPTSAGSDLQSAVIEFLLNEGSGQFAEQIGDQYGDQLRSLAEVGIKTHALLMVYTPKSGQLDPIVTAIRTAAENSGLPRSYWIELVGMLERRAPFADVKQSILTLHIKVGDYLAGDGP